MILQYLIKRTDGEDLIFHVNQCERLLRPQTFPSTPIFGDDDYRIATTGCEIYFSFESAGLHVVAENITATPEQVAPVVLEICQNVMEKTGLVVELITL